MVLVVRAWPEHPPDGRPHIIDSWPRVPVDNYDYRALVDLGENVINLDWDVAVSREDLKAFADRALATPDDVLAVAMPLYTNRTDGGFEWCASRYNPGEQSMRWVSYGEPTCNLFGFGLVYLPHELVKRYVETWPGEILQDITFAGWHYRAVKQEVPLDWSVHPVHIHYDIPEDGHI